jgi:subtilase family serine protease
LKAKNVLCWATVVAIAMLPVSRASAGLPYPTKNTPKGVDLGSSAAAEGATPISVTVALKLRDPEGAKELLKGVTTPGSPSYHQFLTPAQFRETFGPSAASVDQVSASLRALGLTVTRATTTTLRVTGSPAALEKAFQVSLHTYAVPAFDHHPGYTYRAPLSAPTIPAEAGTAVHAVMGLDTKPRYSPRNHRTGVHAGRPESAKPLAAQASTGNTPGNLTVADFAQYYDVTPLYAKGITGHGRTVGIVTLASFTPSDAFAYWAAVGLTVDPNRITVVNVDGGPGAPSDASGSDETSLDVEQSGGIAPGAKVIVYQAPNTNQAFADAFAQAIEDNQAQTVSVSWGNWEWYNNLENSPVTDPATGQTVSELHAFDELFLQAALQGQSFFASSGDAGAYDVNVGTDSNNNPLLPPDYSLALTVDSPASDPFITAAGGTTLPGTQVYNTGATTPPLSIDIPQERVWGWDYLTGLCAILGYDPISCGIFPVGSGGGVSVFFHKPFYQAGVYGVQRSQPGQAFVDELTTPPQLIFALPANYSGRNVPDISFNADPETGYSIYYTSDQNGPEILTFIGGTSFVAPQLNGSTALLGEYVHDRVGLLNIPLYRLAQGHGYKGSEAPLRAITEGNNWFYTGSKGYNPGAGLGTLDVYNLAKALKREGEGEDN